LELNWSTFVLEILNFLVLVWILKRFLYKPVLAVIVRRREGIEKSLAEARSLHEDAEALKARYQARLAEWEQERRQAREQLGGEMEAERTENLAALQAELAQEREKAAVAEDRRQADARHKAEETALVQAARFAARLLGDLAGPELEERLLERILTDLSKLPDERVAALRNNWGRPGNTAVVSSAYPLSESRREKLRQAVTVLAGAPVAVRFEQDEGLLAGIQITLGAWVLGANLRDELKSLAEFANGTEYS